VSHLEGKNHGSNSTPKSQVEFSPIVTIQRKASTLEKPTSKKLVLISKTEEKGQNAKCEE
jgi:hypothetical protein